MTPCLEVHNFDDDEWKGRTCCFAHWFYSCSLMPRWGWLNGACKLAYDFLVSYVLLSLKPFIGLNTSILFVSDTERNYIWWTVKITDCTISNMITISLLWIRPEFRCQDLVLLLTIGSIHMTASILSWTLDVRMESTLSQLWKRTFLLLLWTWTAGTYR